MGSRAFGPPIKQEKIMGGHCLPIPLISWCVRRTLQQTSHNREKGE